MLHRNRLIVTLVAAFSCSVRANVLFVDDDAPLGGDGQTWGTAYRFLQDALFDAAGVRQSPKSRATLRKHTSAE